MTPNERLLFAVETNDIPNARSYLLGQNGTRWSEETLSRLLHIAAKQGFREILNLLLRNSAPVDSQEGEDLDTPLVTAARKGFKDIVSTLVLFDADVNAQNRLNRTALHEACGEGHLDIILLLLENGAGVDSADHKGESPLHLAVSKGQPATVNVLIHHRAEVNREFKNGSFLVHFAAAQGLVAILESLLGAGASVRPSAQLPSPLYLAISNKQTKIIRILLQYGAKATEIDDNGENALHVAGRAGHAAAIGMLLDKGCSIKAKNKSNQTALHLAILGGSITTAASIVGKETNMAVNMGEDDALLEAVNSAKPEFLALFLSRGANIHLRRPLDKCLLHVAVEAERPGNAALLLAYGAALDSLNASRQTPLMFAIVRQSPVMVSLFLAHDRKNINAACAGGYTPLAFATKENIPAVIPVILGSGANIESTGKDGRTALHLAIESGFTKAAECLLKAGSNPNARDTSGQTPLHRLVVGCAIGALVHLLVNHGAKTEIKAKDCCTPLFLAASMERSEMVEILALHGAKRRSAGDRESALVFIKAATAGNTQKVKMYLEHGVDVDATTIDGDSAIGLAASGGHSDVVKVLLNHGANTRTIHNLSGTPLIRAVRNGHVATVEILLNGGADIEAPCVLGMRPLHHACDGKSENAAMVKLLLARRANVEARFTPPHMSKTALHIAAMHSFYDTAKVLLDYGAKSRATNHNGKNTKALIYEHCRNDVYRLAFINHMAEMDRS